MGVEMEGVAIRMRSCKKTYFCGILALSFIHNASALCPHSIDKSLSVISAHTASWGLYPFSFKKSIFNPVLSWGRRHPLVLLAGAGVGVGLCVAYRLGWWGAIKKKISEKNSFKVVLKKTENGCMLSVSDKKFSQAFTGNAAKFLNLASKDASVVKSEEAQKKLLKDCGYTKEKDAMTIKNLLLIASVLTLPQSLTAETFQEFAQACEAVIKNESSELKVISSDRYAICQKALYKNEDRYDVFEKNGWFLCGVFDGHGGPEIANALVKDHNFLGKLYSALSDQVDLNNKDVVNKKITEVFEAQDQDFLKNAIQYERFYEAEGKKESLFETAGSTATIAILSPDKKLFVAYIGDSNVLVHLKSASHYDLGIKHRPYVYDEEKRIKKAAQTRGENIDNVLSKKKDRVSGFEVSRAFGDFSYNQEANKWFKATGIIATPEIKVIAPGGPFGEALFVLLASDGLWDSLPLIIGDEYSPGNPQYWTNFYGKLKDNKISIKDATQELCDYAERGWKKIQEGGATKESGFSSKIKDDITVALIRV